MSSGQQIQDGAREALERISAVTDAALAHLAGDELMDQLLERVRELLAADTAAVLQLDRSGRYLTAVASKGIEEEVYQGIRIPVGAGFTGRIAARRGPLVVEEVDDKTVLSPVLIRKGIRSLLGVPLLAAGTLVGVLHVGTLASRLFSEDDIALLQMAAERVALAIHAQESRTDRAAAMALQRSLVPTTLPQVRGYELGARYVPGHGTVGGDWYDVFTLPTGQVAFALGDVAGAGLPAAVVMGRLRSALRAYALETVDPAEVLTKLDRKVRHFEAESMATVIYGVADPVLAEIQISVAGHPPPVSVRPGGEACVIELPVDPPMGVEAPKPRRSTTVPFAASTVLCFYTDGLIERRDADLDAGTELLRRAVLPGRPEDVCATVMSALVGDLAPDDDTALLVVRAL